MNHRAALILAVVATLTAGALAQARRDVFIESRDHPAIAYSQGPLTDVVSTLNAGIRNGSVKLEFDPDSGYLRSVLDALKVPVDSQSLVFSHTSFQASLLSMRNPRALYFTDDVAVGWVRGGALLEIAAQDPKQGMIFYSLDQKATATPQLKRDDACLACHLSWDTLGVPGYQLQSVFPLPDDKNAYAIGFHTNHDSPLSERWGGWYVTGKIGGVKHMGNVPVMPEDYPSPTIRNPGRSLDSLVGVFDLKGFPTPYSDVVAQMVLAHQVRMANLLTRLGWEARLAAAAPSNERTARVQEAVADLVDYMLFVDEPPLPAPLRGTSGFAERFAGQGPKDRRGRSLRQLDLDTRLMKYPCSYMIDGAAFAALPATVREQVYERLWRILSGRDTAPKYAQLSPADRRAIVEILRDTRNDLPSFFDFKEHL